MTHNDIIRIAREVDLHERVKDGVGYVVRIPNLEKLERFAALVAAAEKELIARWVESWGNDLTIKEIVEGIRTDGNGATRPLKYVTREEPL